MLLRPPRLPQSFGGLRAGEGEAGGCCGAALRSLVRGQRGAARGREVRLPGTAGRGLGAPHGAGEPRGPAPGSGPASAAVTRQGAAVGGGGMPEEASAAAGAPRPGGGFPRGPLLSPGSCGCR